MERLNLDLSFLNMSDQLKNKAIKWVIWSAIEKFSYQGVQFILNIIIARLVLPAEYGLIAMLAIFISLAQTFVDSGFSNALIQKRDRTERDYSTVFYFNIVISLVIYAILYLAAPLIADFYSQPQLKLILRYVGISIILQGITIVQRAKIIIDVDFKLLAKVSLISVIASGLIAVYMAYKGMGVWALVVQSVGNSLVSSILLWVLAKWRPLKSFSWSSFTKLFSYGSKLLISSLIQNIYLNLYSLVIGKYYNATQVGFYNRASSLAQFPSTNVVGIVSRAVFPIMCEMQDNDEKLAKSFTQYLRATCFLIFPLMIGLAVLSKPLVLLILTEKWLPATSLLSILCIAYMWQPIMALNHQILNVKGRSDYFLKADIIKKLIATVILIATLPFGIKILCLGVIIYNLVDMIVTISYAKRVIKTGYIEQFLSILPHLSISICMGIITYLASIAMGNNLWLQLAIGTLSGATSYLLLSYIFKIREFSLLLDLIKKIKR